MDLLGRVSPRLVTQTLAFAGVAALSGTLTILVMQPRPVAVSRSAAGQPITRVDIVLRADSWVGMKVMYSDDQADAVPDGDGDSYRPDAVGLISMAWHLPKAPGSRDRDIAGFAAWPGQSDIGTYDHLEAGDALLSVRQSNVVLFKRWTDSTHSQLEIIQENKPGTPASDVVAARSVFAANNYRPIRYYNVVHSMLTTNFDTLGYYEPSDDTCHTADTSFPGPDAFVSWPARTAKGHKIDILVGDWDGDGRDTLGYYNRDDGTFHLSDDPRRAGPDRYVWDTNLESIRGIQILVGDWDGNGRDSLGYYNPRDASVRLSNVLANGIGDDAKLPADLIPTGVTLLVGDWNGDGRDTLGTYNPQTGDFRLSDATGDTPAKTYAWTTTLNRSPNIQILVGDWDSDHRSSIGYYDPADGYVHLSNGLENQPVDYRSYTGIDKVPNARLIVGDWDGR